MNLATYCQKSSAQPLFFRTLCKAWVARYSPNFDWGRAQKYLGTADLAILA